MERRFVLFIILSLAIMLGYAALTDMFMPPLPKNKQAKREVIAKNDPPVADPDPAKADAQDKQADANPPSSETEKAGQPADAPAARIKTSDPGVNAAEAPAQADVEHPRRWVSLGSYSAASPYLLHVTLNSRGGALECVELTERNGGGGLRFRNLEEPYGYLGYLSLTEVPKGCQVNVVGDGTPAASAVSSDSRVPNGLQPGDILVDISYPTATKKPLINLATLNEHLRHTKAGDVVNFTVARSAKGVTTTSSFDVTLGVRPLEIVHPESVDVTGQHLLSCLLSLERTESLTSEEDPALASIASQMRTKNWLTTVIPGDSPAVEFRQTVDYSDPKKPAEKSQLEIVKRFRIHPRSPAGTDQANATRPPYYLDLEVEIHNKGEHLQRVAYRLEGPNGLPTEGWWYLTKIHPRMFYSAGARDVLVRTERERRLIGTSEIYTKAKKTPKNPETILFTETEPLESRSTEYIGVDTQYFLAALTPQRVADENGVTFRQAVARLLDDTAKIEKALTRTANVSFDMVSQTINIEPGQAHVQKFELFAGPKHIDVLAAHGLTEAIEYGWFPWVVKPLSAVLHFFHSIVGNWAIAIVMLTVLVRACMFPLSRKAASNAQMMQQLAPEMKKITEKHKNDMEKRAAAQRELFKQHNYNPLGGCWMVFVQLPIFVGLYRCLAIDIDLRQAPLIPGIEWCSNLAGPDRLFEWKSYLPAMLADETGWLGPYFNVLPFITIGLFLLQQKMFTPPATDEQTRMQMTMMKYMTVFMGVMFYKVPAGLCIYFIMSSLWSIGERKLVPKPKLLPPPPSTSVKKNDSFLERMLKMAEKMPDANKRPAQRSRRK